MAPLSAAEREFAPAVDPARTTDLPDRRRTVAAPAPDARRRPPLDSLAIGAPLTAAFIGALLIEPGLAGDPAAGAQAGVSAAAGLQADDADAAAGAATSLPAASGQLGSAASGLASRQGSATDPVSVEGQAPGGPLAREAGSSGYDGAMIAQTAAPAAPAAVAGGLSINMTIAGQSAGEAAGGLTDDGSGGGTIGKTIDGTDGDDVIHGTPGNDVISGGAGDDEIHGHAGDDLLDGGTGDDQLFGGTGDDQLLGGTGQDQLHGGSGEDDLLGGTGDDRLFGDGGRDTLDGETGDDLVDGGAGADHMQGGTGDDVLVAGDLHDVALDNIAGPEGGGSDTLRVDDGFAASLSAVGRPESVTFVFSEGLGSALPAGTHSYAQQVAPGIENMVLTGFASHDVIGDDGANQITGNAGDNALHGRGGDDILIGGAGDDLLDGGVDSDRLEGGLGDDLLNGSAGADDLHGGAGDDILRGGGGVDQLYGGAGNDSFRIGLSDSAIDTVFDHEGHNQLVIEGGTGDPVQTALVGDDLYVMVNQSVVATISGYRGHADAWAGIDAGHGLKSIADLMASRSGAGDQSGSAGATLSATAASEDVLGGYLSSPNHVGGAGADQLIGTSAPDWLSGGAGGDRLQGDAGADVLDGGAGADLLEGGAGGDRYLFESGDWDLDTIRDAEGSNVAELHGFAGARLEGRVVGNDLYVVADHAPLFKVENFVGHEDSFAGVEVDGTMVATQDLFSS